MLKVSAAKRLIVFGISLYLGACADGVGFKEDSKRSSDQNALETPNLPGSHAHSDPDSISTDGSTPLEPLADGDKSGDPGAPPPPLPPGDKSVVDECLKQWTKPPFTAEEAMKPQVINIDSDVNNNALLYSDTTDTEKPKLFLVNFNANVGNQGTVALKNAKGWYCLHIKAKVINNFRIELGCTTQLAIVTQNARNDNKFEQVRDVCP